MVRALEPALAREPEPVLERGPGRALAPLRVPER